ncbi:7834_t:CDS:2, partial [Gigaspora rosea]
LWCCTSEKWYCANSVGLTLVAFLMTTFLSGSKVSITANNSSLTNMLYLMALTLNLELTFQFDKDLKHARKPKNLLKLDMTHTSSSSTAIYLAYAIPHIVNIVGKWNYNELQQKDTKKVDLYATKFQKLLNRINTDNGFSNGFIV